METQTTINGITIELKKGDITFQSDIEAIVNAANAELRIGGGFYISNKMSGIEDFENLRFHTIL